MEMWKTLHGLLKMIGSLAKLGATPMKNDIHFCYYALAFVDVLGQQQAFSGIERVPDTPEDKKRVGSVLRENDAFLTSYREGFKNYFDAYKPSSGIGNTLSPDQKTMLKELTKMPDVKLRGFSDLQLAHFSLQTDSPSDSHYGTTVNGVFSVFMACGIMFLVSLSTKHALRGAIEIGPGYEREDDEIYGPVLNSAYNLESQKAQYPRILIGDGVMDFLKTRAKVEGSSFHAKYCRDMATRCLNMVIPDQDGLLMLHYLGEGFREIVHSPSYKKSAKVPDVYKSTIDEAFNFVKTEYRRRVENRDTKLALRYSRLLNYFSVYVPAKNT